MREVNNNTANTGNVNFQGIQPRKDDFQPEVLPVETREVTDLGKMPSEVIGRSQVSKTAQAKDVEFFRNNPEKAEALVAFCEELQNKGYTYEEACAIMAQTADEIFN